MGRDGSFLLSLITGSRLALSIAHLRKVCIWPRSQGLSETKRNPGPSNGKYHARFPDPGSPRSPMLGFFSEEISIMSPDSPDYGPALALRRKCAQTYAERPASSPEEPAIV